MTNYGEEGVCTLERALIAHASPTLAGLKPGSLFSHPIREGFHGEYVGLRALLGEKGLTLTVLRVRRGMALIYLYRADALAAVLRDEAVRTFLRGCGYAGAEIADALRTLRGRLRSSDGFPHEIGVFLGYPLTDVLGFIRNEGRNCLCCGLWKVYANERDALRAFARFRRCRSVYERLFASGCPLVRLAVAAGPARRTA